MPRLTAAAALSPAQATDLARLLDLQAEWQLLKDDGRDHSTARLQGLQWTFEAFRLAQAAYAARYGAGPVPEGTPTTPARLAAWCRAARAIVHRADPAPGGGPTHLAARAYQLADGLAGPAGRPPVVRAAEADAREALVAALEVVEASCAQARACPPSDEAPALTGPNQSPESVLASPK
jgi:hypothetical protein